MSSIPSLIKWSGSKRKQAPEIAHLAPKHKRYIEPFLGGGALLYLLGNEQAYCSDIYSPLINLWKKVRDEPTEVIEIYEKNWLQLQRDLPEYYYTVRDRFNKSKSPHDLNFLARTCVNGIIRFSKNGVFNNSFHLSRRGMSPEKFSGIVMNWSGVIQDVRFECQDYEVTLKDATSDDFVYLDPPYAGSRNRYIHSIDTSRLFENLADLNKRGVKWAMSFDGQRGQTDYTHPVPEALYLAKIDISNGHSHVSNVLNGPKENVIESLYLNYEPVSILNFNAPKDIEVKNPATG